MRNIRLIVMVVCVGLIAGCESTDTADQGNAAAKYEAAKRRAEESQQQHGPVDEGTRNLWNAQRDVANRDGSMSRY